MNSGKMSRKKTEEKLCKNLWLFGVLLVFAACTEDGMYFFPDLLRTSPFEVLNWSPGEGYHPDLSDLSLSLVFSHTPDRASVERHFSLSGDGEKINGIFHWEDKMMTYIPAVPLEINRDYVLALAADAHDQDGLSMDTAFGGRFTTRPDNTRPVLISLYPEMDAVIDDIRAEICLVFSQNVPLNSLRDYVSFDPSLNGAWRIEGGGTRAVFTPVEPWTYGKRYKIEISPSFAGNTSRTLGNTFTSVFIIGSDHEKPHLTEALRITKNGNAETLAAGLSGENAFWEKDDRLLLVFSKPVDTLSVKNCLSAEGAPSIRMETIPGLHKEAFFSFENPPAFESRFSFKLKTGVKDRVGNESADEYIFRIFANGDQSRPPQLIGIRLPLAPGSQTDLDLAAYGIDSLFEDLPVTDNSALVNKPERYPYSVKTDTWIECYFDTAPGASIDLFSLMALFRIETSNNVLVFSPRLIKTSGFSVSTPRQGWEQYLRLEIKGFLTNTVNSGVVNIHINPGLKDSNGNKNENLFRISLLK